MEFTLCYRPDLDAHRIRGATLDTRETLLNAGYATVGSLRAHKTSGGLLVVRPMGTLRGVDESILNVLVEPMAHFARTTLGGSALVQRHAGDMARLLAGFEQVSIDLYQIARGSMYSLLACPLNTSVHLYKDRLVYEGEELESGYHKFALAGQAQLPKFALNPSIPTMFPARREPVIDVRPIRG